MAAKKAKTVKKPVVKKLVRKLPPPVVAKPVEKVAPVVAVPVVKVAVVQPKAEPQDTKKAALLGKILALKNQKVNGHEVRIDQLDELAAMIEK